MNKRKNPNTMNMKEECETCRRKIIISKNQQNKSNKEKDFNKLKKLIYFNKIAIIVNIIEVLSRFKLIKDKKKKRKCKFIDMIWID